jgi:hypothetical protein
VKLDRDVVRALEFLRGVHTGDAVEEAFNVLDNADVFAEVDTYADLLSDGKELRVGDRIRHLTSQDPRGKLREGTVDHVGGTRFGVLWDHAYGRSLEFTSRADKCWERIGS